MSINNDKLMKTITPEDLAAQLQSLINVANNLNVYEHPEDKKDVELATKILKKWKKENNVKIK